MSENENGPSPEKSRDPAFMERFEQTIKTYANAVETGDDDAAAQAAMAALLQAGMEAINNPTPNILLLQSLPFSCQPRPLTVELVFFGF